MIKSGSPAKRLLFYGGLLVAMLSLMPLAAPALADTVVGSSATFDWRTWAAGNVNENGFPYWDHASFDGLQRNIGYYLTNSGAFASCSSNCGPGVLPFWGSAYTPDTAGGAADPKFYFSATDPGQLAALKLEVTANTNTNEVGWFETNSTGTLDGTKHTLFTGPQGAGATATFTPSSFYGYYVISGGGQTFETLSQFDSISSSTPQNHFAVFKEGDPSYWIGVEDLITTCGTPPANPACVNGNVGSDFDYNDEVFRVTPVPEPGTMLLGGTGLLLFGIALRRRFFRR